MKTASLGLICLNRYQIKNYRLIWKRTFWYENNNNKQISYLLILKTHLFFFFIVKNGKQPGTQNLLKKLLKLRRLLQLIRAQLSQHRQKLTHSQSRCCRFVLKFEFAEILHNWRGKFLFSTDQL